MAKVLSRFANGEVSEIGLGNGDEIRAGYVNPIINGIEEFGTVIGFEELEEGEVEVNLYDGEEGRSVSVF